MYEIRQAGTKGLGVFAKVFIPRGTRIFSERPLLAIRPDQGAGDIYAAFRLLPLEQRTKLLQLSSHITKESSVARWTQVIWWTVKRSVFDVYARIWGNHRGMPARSKHSIKEHIAILNVFRSNCFDIGSSQASIQQAIFPRISRMNHSCVPNAQGNFHDEMGRFNVHATRDIKAGKELTLNYLPEHGAVKATRQSRLLSGYGFLCDCPACDLTLLRGRDGEEKRLQAHRKLSAYAEGLSNGGLGSAEAELQTIEEFMRLFEGEGIAGRELSTMYFEAAKLNMGLGRREEALRCAEKGLEIDRDCLSTDHPLYQHGVATVQELKKSFT
ncbi:SET domain-containing protein [Lepidopterella palustris CBS 459.81]|uniref:SET domain-containing protein n=1 Tax=Lepidopterella palustris CBS 459.81 TaxID=1314670 RepID=A0A8E2DZN5_9PEZI|nr:SET domain-containing protein [Lepidopterella palustris CBS 459.81]